MADHDKFVLWHAGDAAHQPGRADEGLRHHGYRRHSLPLRCNRIMQTARRATASIADTGDDGIPFRNLTNDVGISWRAVVRLGAPYDVSYAEVLPQHAFEVREVARGSLLPVRDETDGLALERRRSRGRLGVGPAHLVSRIEHAQYHLPKLLLVLWVCATQL